MRIAIVDDLVEDRTRLTEILSTLCMAQIRTFESAEELLINFSEGQFDLLFLDIYMDGINGMEAARKLRTIDKACKLIFVTLTESFAVSSYDVQASYYLLKPVSQEQVAKALQVCSEQLLQEQRVLRVLADRYHVNIPFQNILYVDVYRNAVQIHCQNEIARTYMKFSEISALLADDIRFLECFRGCIVNLENVKEIRDEDFILTNGERVAIRKKGISSIKKAYANYIFTNARSRSQ